MPKSSTLNRGSKVRSEELEEKLPQNVNAERSLLGAVIIQNQNIETLSVKPEDFFLTSHRMVFEAMLEMDTKHRPIDLITLSETLERRGHLVFVGGPAYISSLIDGIPKVSNVEHYEKIVREKSILRALIHRAHSITNAAMAADGSPEGLVDSAIESILELSLAAAANNKSAQGVSYWEAAKRLLSGFKTEATPRVNTGVKALDKILGGFLPGELVTITAHTGVGKTLLAQQIRRRACQDGLHTLYCSAEMTAEHLVSREIASEAGVPHWKMRQSERIDQNDMAALVRANVHECKVCRILDGELSLKSIRLAARRLKKQGTLDAIILDYDELIEAPGEDEIERQSVLVRGTKFLATELKVPAIIISQIRKTQGGDKRSRTPTLEGIYGSGAKSKHSSIVLFVNREYVQKLEGDETEAEIFILKARDGGLGRVKSRFNVRTLRFDDYVEVA